MSKQITLFVSRFGGIGCAQVAPVVRVENYEPAEWTNSPITVAIPDAWEIKESNAGTLELYDTADDHRSLVLTDGHVDAINHAGFEHLLIVAR